jgi:hypothetical protein
MKKEIEGSLKYLNGEMEKDKMSEGKLNEDNSKMSERV